MSPLVRRLCTAAFLATALPGLAGAQPVEPVLALAKKERQPLLDTLKELVSIETGSRDLEGLDRAAKLIAARLSALGGKVELVDTSEGAYRMEDTPAKIGKVVHARFEGRGTKKILLLAHMDTVYLRGMLAKQPFRVEGDRAYGLGIADDKNGVALILHVLAMLKAMDFRGYGLLTVLVNADEEMSSPGSRKLITQLGAEHDAVFSCEASRVESDKLALATAGIASVILKVKGRASHAGQAPEQGRNALYELAHHMLQTRDLSNPATGLKMNWTLASGGSVRNAIPAEASATADVRVLRVSDYDGIERAVRERIKNKLIPDTQVDMTFERRRPPLEATPASRMLGDHARRVYAELGKTLVVDALAEGGGTDAAFASLNTKAPVLERFGLQGFGAHSNDAEYIAVDSIEPRLYLLARLIMDVSQGKDRK
ncbi:MAG: M20/M25/M40 family metallo-hydrolase [Betaproteobacteria bacterium]|nr:MAG: M20/M25/M40 family metallo-hydrolase [Betaproteobacteria bacterium]